MARSASGIAGLALGATLLSTPERVFGANDRISIGMIGVGARANDHLREIVHFSQQMNAQVTAVCDVWDLALRRASSSVWKSFGARPRTFTDYEDLLALDDIDAVVIATPDFHHARMLAKAVRAGKDVYVEKPMAMEIEEAKDAVRAVEETGRIVQVGTQRRSEGICRAGAEFVRSGALGKISRVEAAWNDCAPRWRRGVASVKEEEIDWRRFLGHRKYRPFDPHQFREWHLYRDFSIGTLGLLGAHEIDLVHWYMDDPLPVSAVAHGGNLAWNDGRENEDTIYALLQYPKGFILRYLSGLGNSSGSGCYFYGNRGSFDTSSWKATGAGGGSDRIGEDTDIKPLPSDSHMREFLECVRTRKTPGANVYAGYGHSLASIIGTMALRSGCKVFYDVETKSIRES